MLGEHINSLEARAWYNTVRLATLAKAAGGEPQRHLFLCDSSVVVAAARKGRCRSRDVLRRMRPGFALLLALGSRVCTVYVESSRNPADAPSRAFGPPRPPQPPPPQ